MDAPGSAPPVSEGRAEAPKRRQWLTRNLAVLCGVSFLQDAASELLYPILPIFLTSTLGAPVAVVGAIEGAAEAVASGTKIMAGRLADRSRRRPLVAAGYGLAAVGKMLIAVASVWPVVLAGRAVDRLGKGVRGAPRDALLVQDVPLGSRGKAFGLHRTADTLGAVVGPLLGLAGYELLHHQIRPLLIAAVIPAVLSPLLVVALREAPRSQPLAPRDKVTLPAAPRSLPPAFRRVLTAVFVFSLVNFPDALLLLRVRALGFSVAGVILAYAAYNASYAALSYPAGSLSDKWPPSRVFGLGLCCFTICYLGLGLINDGTWVWPLLVIYGGFTAATDGVGKAWVSRLVPRHEQGRAQGLFQGATSGAVLIAGVWAGLLWHGSGRVPLIASGAVAAATAIYLLAGRADVPGPAVSSDVGEHATAGTAGI